MQSTREALVKVRHKSYGTRNVYIVYYKTNVIIVIALKYIVEFIFSC